MKKILKHIKKFRMTAKSIIVFSSQRVEAYGAQYTIFGVFAVLNYIVPYFMWAHTNSIHYNTFLYLRTLAGLLCFLLIMKDYWPARFNKYLPLYWHFTLLYCLPFLTTYMLLDSHASMGGLLNMVLALFLLAVLVDWMSFVIILPAGIISAYVFYWWTQEKSTYVAIEQDALLWATYMYVFAVMIGVIFSRNKQRIDQEKLRAIRALGGVIAHEMRTPLVSISLGASGLKDHLPKLIEGYELAKKASFRVRPIDPMHYNALKGMPHSFSRISCNALTIIDMLLMNLKESPFDAELRDCSMADCVETALKEYPFTGGDKELVDWQNSNDFQFRGSKELLVHVLFNLLKNSVYYVKAAGKGNIIIWLESNPKENRLHFKDTGKGISPEILPYIFNRFYTRTKHGTGIGLAFCKLVMEGLGGEIFCESVEGKYVEFILSLPSLVTSPSFLKGFSPPKDSLSRLRVIEKKAVVKLKLQ